MKRLQAIATSLTLIVAIAFVARVGFAVSQARKIPDAALAHVPFENETGSIAQAIATGQGYSNPFARNTGPTAWLTPIYPWLVVVAFKIFGVFTIRAFYFLVFLNIVFSSAACVPLYAVGKRIAGVGVGAAAAWLWAIYPNAVMTPFEWIWDTSLAALLSVVLLWATMRLAESRRMRDWCLYGLLWGFVLMTNPSLGSLLPFLLGWAAYRAWWKAASPRSAGKKWLLQPSAALAIAILCCVPWTIRNYTVFHRFVPLRSNFPLELYIGNNENYDDLHPHYPGDGHEGPRDLALHQDGRDAVHGRGDAQGEEIYLCPPARRGDFVLRAIHRVLGRNPESDRQIYPDRFVAGAQPDSLRDAFRRRSLGWDSSC